MSGVEGLVLIGTLVERQDHFPGAGDKRELGLLPGLGGCPK